MCYGMKCYFEDHMGDCMASTAEEEFAEKNNMTICGLAFYLECHPAPNDPVRMGFKKVQAERRAAEIRFWKEYDK